MTNFITDAQRAQLLANGRHSLTDEGFDPSPVVKLFTPDAGATWLLTEIDPDDDDHAFGLCDLGLGYPELGYPLCQTSCRLLFSRRMIRWSDKHEPKTTFPGIQRASVA